MVSIRGPRASRKCYSLRVHRRQASDNLLRGQILGEKIEKVGESNEGTTLVQVYFVCTNRMPKVLESQKSSNSARIAGGVAPSVQPRKARSFSIEKSGYLSRGGPEPGSWSCPSIVSSDFA